MDIVIHTLAVCYACELSSWQSKWINEWA